VGLRRHLSYSNVMASVAVFLALGGGAYAISLPRDSVGARELEKNAVGSSEVKDRSLRAADLEPSLVGNAAGVTSDAADPPAAVGRVLKQAKLNTEIDGRLYVIATVRDPYLTCSTGGSCSATWGVYVDNRRVPNSGLALQANAGEGDGVPDQTLFGVTATVEPGSHALKLGRTDSGAIDSVGQLGAQVGAFAPGG
jgi:hypothetical protein